MAQQDDAESILDEGLGDAIANPGAGTGDERVRWAGTAAAVGFEGFGWVAEMEREEADDALCYDQANDCADARQDINEGCGQIHFACD